MGMGHIFTSIQEHKQQDNLHSTRQISIAGQGAKYHSLALQTFLERDYLNLITFLYRRAKKIISTYTDLLYP